MRRFLNVSTAARLAGVSRGEIQREIRAGNLQTFEGEVHIDELRSVYPEARLEDSSVLERMSRIQNNAMAKVPDSIQVSERALADEINRLRGELAETRSEVRRHQELVMTMKARLEDLQQGEDCTRQQKLVLQAMITWMLSAMERRG